MTSDFTDMFEPLLEDRIIKNHACYYEFCKLRKQKFEVVKQPTEQTIYEVSDQIIYTFKCNLTFE